MKRKSKIRWPSRKDEMARLKMYQAGHRKRIIPAEVWAKQFLDNTKWNWTPQAIWGFRIFDFWCSKLGCAIEIDGPTHNKGWDRKRDEFNFRRSAIVVFRVSNFNESEMRNVLKEIEKLDTWLERRKKMGLLTLAERKKIFLNQFENKSEKEDPLFLEFKQRLLREP